MTATQEFKLVTSKEILREANVEIGVRMFDYLRNKLKLIPPPIIESTGKGAGGLYTRGVPILLKHIKQAQDEGVPLRNMKDFLNDEIQKTFHEMDMGRKFWAARKAVLKIEKTTASPKADFVMKDRKTGSYFIIDAKSNETGNLRRETGKLKRELKAFFRDWDGETEPLAEIRRKLDEFDAKATLMKLTEPSFEKVRKAFEASIDCPQVVD